MRPPIQEPVEELKDVGTAHERTVTTHPAFAEIQASRISGGQVLYGSDLQHQHYMAIRVYPSELHRKLASDWHHSSVRPYIEVAMSEAQWQAFVSSPNAKGSPCTLTHLNGKQIPELPRPKPRGKQFAEEAAESAKEALAEVAGVVAEIEAMNISGVKKKALIGRIGRVTSALQSSLPFVMDQFVEHMEDQVEKAKAEINSHARAVLGPNAVGPALEAPAGPKRIVRSR